MDTKKPTSNGLDGVSIGTTALSLVDGGAGKLVIAGHNVEDLAETRTFEDVAYLLLHGRLPTSVERTSFIALLSAHRCRIFQKLDTFEAALALSNPLDSLRAAVAQLSEQESFEESAALILGAIPLFLGAWHRRRDRQPIAQPTKAQSTAEAILYFLNNAPHPALTLALSKYLLTVSDHGMNASTFTARVIASTQSDIVSAVTGAIGALKGPLHGGAPGPVLTMLDEIGSADQAAAWIAKKLAAKERIMGMGHRIYRVRDPRAAVFERVLTTMPAELLKNERLGLARKVEQEAEKQLAALKPERALKANVEFYTAVLLETCGIPGDLFTAVFAAGRAAGWLAHYKEQRETGRLIRPSVEYIGQ